MSRIISYKKMLQSDSGIVSLIVTLVLMVVIGLMVIGFSQISRRSQRQVLDRQLSSQAYYAAQSGINDAYQKIKSGQVDLTNDYTSDCNRFMVDQNLTGKSKLDSAGTVRYTCLLIDPSPSTLEYKNVDDTSKGVLLKTGGNPIARIVISWQNTDSAQTNFNCGAKAQYTSKTNWPCTTGVMRADITGVPAGGITWSNLDNQQMTAFFMPSPSQSDGNLDYVSHAGYNTSGVSWFVQCTTNPPSLINPKYCNASIDTSNAQPSYFLRMRSIYVSSSVTVTAYDSSNNPVPLIGAQVLIDATGKANDILRRQAVRVPVENPGPFPDFSAFSAQSLCKQLTVNAVPGYVSGSGGPGCDPASAN
ncbi:MAG: hypothetical protein NVS1B7_2710 [Candidatus Saccharimonadales bacterium]